MAILRNFSTKFFEKFLKTPKQNLQSNFEISPKKSSIKFSKFAKETLQSNSRNFGPKNHQKMTCRTLVKHYKNDLFSRWKKPAFRKERVKKEPFSFYIFFFLEIIFSFLWFFLFFFRFQGFSAAILGWFQIFGPENFWKISFFRQRKSSIKFRQFC